MQGLRQSLRASFTYLLLCVRAGAGPLGNNVLLGLVVCRKGKSNAGEGGALQKNTVVSTSPSWNATRDNKGVAYKIDTDNQLSLAPAVALDFGGRVALVGGEGPGGLGRCRRRVAGRASISGGAARDGRRAASHDGRWIPGNRRGAGVDGRRTSNHLRRWSAVRALVGERAGAAEGTGRAWRVVC
jgi:hypothetical protein